MEEVRTRVEGLQRDRARMNDFVLYTLIYKFITAFSSKVT